MNPIRCPSCGHKLRRPRLALPVDAIAAAYLDNATIQALADQYGVDQTTIRNRLIWAGVTIRRRGPRSPYAEKHHAEP